MIKIKTINYTDSSLYSNFKIHNYLPEFLFNIKGFLAGGALVSTINKDTINDFDLFFTSEQSRDEAIEIITKNGCDEVFKSKNAITFSTYKKDVSTNDWFSDVIESAKLIKIQVILKVYDSIESVFDNFDFYHNMQAIDLQNKKYIAAVDKKGNNIAFKYSLTKRLIFNRNVKQGLSLQNRLIKFSKRGYHIARSEMTALTFHIFNKISKFNNLGELIDDLNGIYHSRIDIIENCLDKTKPIKFEDIEQIATKLQALETIKVKEDDLDDLHKLFDNKTFQILKSNDDKLGELATKILNCELDSIILNTEIVCTRDSILRKYLK